MRGISCANSQSLTSDGILMQSNCKSLKSQTAPQNDMITSNKIVCARNGKIKVKLSELKVLWVSRYSNHIFLYIRAVFCCNVCSNALCHPHWRSCMFTLIWSNHENPWKKCAWIPFFFWSMADFYFYTSCSLMLFIRCIRIFECVKRNRPSQRINQLIPWCRCPSI